ncbi:MAG: nucleotide exchange factor GrpE, partial [Candidatus Aminicenantes bacterium]|nr:nucleotide exchange factor GrpE [Candidatus Aminicenantes bacterium]
MSDDSPAKPPLEPDEIKPSEGAEIEFLTGTGGRPPGEAVAPPAGRAPGAPEPKPGKGKTRKKEGEGHPSPETRELRREVEHLKKALRDVEGRAEALETEKTSRLQEAAEYKDKFLRLAAEMENLRKRLEREKNEFYQFALEGILREILQVMDNLERALKTGDEADGRAFREGVDLILKQLVDLIRKQGVTPIVREDRRFDPEVHQAIFSEESE